MNSQLKRAMELEQQFDAALPSQSIDWLGRYRTWLDANNIHAETDGWPSEEAYDQANIDRFIQDQLMVGE